MISIQTNQTFKIKKVTTYLAPHLQLGLLHASLTGFWVIYIRRRRGEGGGEQVSALVDDVQKIVVRRTLTEIMVVVQVKDQRIWEVVVVG